ncbi:DNA cytosine methyltransferase [Roseococcus sp. SDR]|nr:DNA cytosine methyltransferase [Roseococcus sp. SDR]MBS7790272.1 DNA cytosine methyltransferase [Roseococcus sp. SDR]MBV1845586.1 DNA cytosine methyltransferase [Roseococcus sp. SDR]
MLVSLFCGLGGMDLGFEAAGFRVGAAYDIRQDSVATYNLNRPDAAVAAVQDIRDLKPADILATIGGACSGVIGGPPCQSFTQANRHQSDDDPRREMLGQFARILGGLNRAAPVPFFVIENVPCLQRDPHLGRLKTLEARLRRIGFNVTRVVLNAGDHGTPQNRRRLFLVGINRQLHPGVSWKAPEPAEHRLTVRDAIGALPEPVTFASASTIDEIPHHPNHWCMTPKSRRFLTPGLLRAGDGNKRSFKVLAWDRPSLAVAYGNREVHVHPGCHRRLSIFEAMLLQGFPAEFRVAGTMSSQITQVSEAVPPPLAHAVAGSIKALLHRTELRSAA